MGFPYRSTAQYEDSASTTPVNFSVAWESHNRQGGVLSLFFGEKLSCNVFTFVPTNSIKAAELRKIIRSTSYLNTLCRPLSLLQLSKSWHLSTRPPLNPVSFTWVGPQYLSTGPPQYLSMGRGQVPVIQCQIKLRIINQYGISGETAFQIALRNCSKEVGKKASVYVILVKGEFMQWSTYFLQKISAILVKVTASHEEQTSPWRILMLF